MMTMMKMIMDILTIMMQMIVDLIILMKMMMNNMEIMKSDNNDEYNDNNLIIMI